MIRTDIINTKRLFKSIFAAALATAVLASSMIHVFAMPPYDNIPEGASEETWNRLQDNTIEYDEIGDLVQYFNPSYTMAMDSAGGNVETLSLATDQFSTYYRDMDLGSAIDSTRDAISGISSAMENPALSDSDRQKYQQQLATLNATLEMTKQSQSTMEKTVRSLNQTVRNTKKRVEISLRPVKRQLEFGMQSVFLQYHQLLINRDIVKKQTELYETILSASTNSEGQGLATESERLVAENNLNSAKLQLEQLDSSLETIRRSMGLQLGWGVENLPDIGTLPEPDVEFVDTTNPDADKTAAFMHNSELKDVERYSGGTAQRNVTDIKTNEYRGQLVAKMDSLYADMKNKKALYEAALTGKERAEREKAAADRQYQLGLLGNSEYEALQMSYISGIASYELAKLNLFSSINTYKWAVDGVVTLE